MDAPFPDGMMADIEKFFREVHSTLQPGRGVYDEVFATQHFFPLQRKREMRRMLEIASQVGACVTCKGTGGTKGTTGNPLDDLPCVHCRGNKTGPATIMEIGADKGGGLYHWCMLPTVKNVIACEIRGTPYAEEFKKAFPNLGFQFLSGGSLQVMDLIRDSLCTQHGPIVPIDVLFIDGDKLGMLKDFDTYLPLMRRQTVEDGIVKPGGVVFIHDVQDHEPYLQFKEIMQRQDYRGTEVILDRSEYFDFVEEKREPATPWEGWLQHWKGRSCGVGVVYL